MNNTWSKKTFCGFASLLIGLALAVGACTPQTQTETEAGAEIVQEESDVEGEGVVIESSAPISVSSSTSTGVMNAEDTVIRASRLLDYDFENTTGDVSGEVEDILIDTSTGQVLFVTIEYGGFLDLGTTHLAMPLSAFSWNTDNALVLNIEEERLENFPELGDDWPDLSTDIWDDEVNQFWLDQGIPSNATVDDSSQVMYMEEFLNLDIGDMGFGEGDIDDMLIDLSQSQARYVVADYGNELFNDNLIAIPFTALFGRSVNGEIIFGEDINLQVLEAAPTLEREGFDNADIFGRDFDSEIVSYWQSVGYSIEPKPGS